MANEQHQGVLKQGVEQWNRWRKQNPEIKPDLSGMDLINRDLSRADFANVDLSRADLSKAQLSHASLHGANLESSTLILSDLLGAVLNESDLSGASLFGAFLFGTRLKGANLKGANLMGTSLMGADLTSADLTGAHLMGANFHDADLTKANFTNANLTAASLVGTRIEHTVFSNCSVYGVSAFNLEGRPAVQSNLVITPVDESAIVVDDLEAAQFIYLLISGQKIPLLLEKVQSRFVLVIGNFRSGREGVLSAILETLRRLDYTSIVAHFNAPISRELTERILLLSRFVRVLIADLTDSKPVLQLLRDSSSSLQDLPVQPLIQGTLMQNDALEHVLDPLPYQSSEDLPNQLQQRFSSDFS